MLPHFSNSMKILIINCILSTAEHGIIERKESISDCMISNFARGFVELGHSVTILASQEFKPMHEETLPFDVIYFPSLMSKIFKPSLLPWPQGLKSWLQHEASNYDLIISSESFQIATLIATTVCPERLMIWQEMDRHQRLFFKIPSKLWHNYVVRLFMRRPIVVPRSEPAKHFISRYHHNTSDRIVDHGTDAHILYPGDEVKQSFVVVSQLVKRKNVDKIITKFSKLLTMPQYKDYQLDIIGEGDQKQELMQLVKQLHINSQVTFHGFLSHQQLAEPLRESIALLVDTSNDLNMVTIAEAITSGTPVITNTKPSTASFIADNGLGVVRDDWDENDLIHVIEHYDQMHAACVKAGRELTNVACARKMIDISKGLIPPTDEQQ